jgi:nicotinamidase-related amidase
MSAKAISSGADDMTQGPALLLIDAQVAMATRRDAGDPWAEPQAEARIAALLAAFRTAGLPVIHVHHHATDPSDDFHPTHPGAQPLPAAAPLPGEPVVIKRGSSAFIGTDLADRLAALGDPMLVIAGGEVNYCVNSTTRMAGNLGYQAAVATDALIGFGQRLRDGRGVSAGDVMELTLADLDGSFARLASTEDILAWLA